MLAQHLCDCEDEIGCGNPRFERAGELEAHDLWRHERNRLAEHCRFGLDSADAPAEHSQAIDHGGVAVGPDESVGHCEVTGFVAHGRDHGREVFEVDLVHDPHARRHDPEAVECLLGPPEE